jgi:DNA-binding GntR family transcriptional regulator
MEGLVASYRDSQTPVYLTIAGQLRARIISGRYRPGDRLPAWDALASEFGVSRLTARRAVQQLAAEGLIDVVPRRGVYVRSEAA